jgi:hypothetical protein
MPAVSLDGRGGVATPREVVPSSSAVRRGRGRAGGYLFFEADDLDAAIELAARIPAARMGGAVEVRPIAEY